jgi:hypothetical protein
MTINCLKNSQTSFYDDVQTFEIYQEKWEENEKKMKGRNLNFSIAEED